MKNMASSSFVITGSLLLGLGAFASSAQANQSTTAITQDSMTQLTASWPEASKKAIAEMTNRYGQPNEATASMVVWHNNGPWKRSIVFKEEVTHLFPKKHTDVLEQFVDYRVPPEKFSKLAAYDGSVIAERTKGELSARCDKEAMNILALNLSDEIVKGVKTVEQARMEFGKSAMAFMKGKTNQYTAKLNIPPQKDTADPGEGFMKDMMGVSKADDNTSKQ